MLVGPQQSSIDTLRSVLWAVVPELIRSRLGTAGTRALLDDSIGARQKRMRVGLLCRPKRVTAHGRLRDYRLLSTTTTATAERLPQPDSARHRVPFDMPFFF